LCKLDANICGGIEKASLQCIYGANGKEHTPTDSELALAFQQLLNAAECRFAVECGEMTRVSCEEYYGTNGRNKHNRPSDEQVNNARPRESPAKVQKKYGWNAKE